MGRCRTEKCTKTAYYNYEGMKPQYCTDCKLSDMVSCKKKTTCVHENCPKARTYNILGQTPKYCKDHKKDGMINTRSPRCIENGCDKRPTFGLLKGKATLGNPWCSRIRRVSGWH